MALLEIKVFLKNVVQIITPTKRQQDVLTFLFFVPDKQTVSEQGYLFPVVVHVNAKLS